MARPDDWHAQFCAVIEACKAQGYDWNGGTCLDMLRLCGDAVSDQDVTAEALLLGHRLPATKRDVLKTLANAGGLEAAIETVAWRCNFPEIAPDMAALGDWGVADYMGDPDKPNRAEGVVKIVDGWAFRIPEHGLALIDAAIAPVRRAWAVG